MLPDIGEADADNQLSLEGTITFDKHDLCSTHPAADTLRHTLSDIISVTPPLSNNIVSILSRRGYDALLPMRSIPSQFRAMSSSKRLPTEPSHFVSLIFRSLKAFFGIGSADGPGAALKSSMLRAYAEEVFENVAQR